ncbi:hypothetical protein P280DRAFT_470741 [Massarina eburnea CBS 473.64]|uniref:Uncharacterized protein n=1 Tax=Massarina eburnea CBS 473.64 TaxID=1395130 RepID=A0A6A6RX97_9PLEO|nr:hypothetical protein P280DRAFT_470741 [Massarina eburnea CBS 473.64]
MGFLDDAFKTLDDIGQEIGQHAGYAASDISRVLGSAGQKINKHISPSTFKALEKFGEDASRHVGATADDIWKALLGAGEEFGKHTGPVIGDVGKAFDGFGREVGKHIFSAAKEAEKVDWENLPVDIKGWIERHPEQTMMIIAGIAATPVAVASVPALLAAFGFTAEGIAAGSIAAGIQSSIGNVAAGSIFATLMSAGQAGAGLGAIQGIVGAITGLTAAGVNIPGFIDVTNEDPKADRDKGKVEK